MSGRNLFLCALAIVPVLGLAGCASGQPAPPTSPVVKAAVPVSPVAGTRPQDVEYTVHDYTIDGPAEMTAGWTRVHLENQGRHAHQVAFIKLDDGRTGDDLLAALRANPHGGLPAFARWYGGPNVVDAGDRTDATILLSPGQYAVACFMPDAAGNTHVLRDMIAPVTVKAGAPTAPLVADLTITEVEFGFGLFEAVEGGPRTIRVRNDGRQPHELQLAELAPGKTVEDYLNAADETGPEVGRSIGGLAPLEPGAEGYFSHNFGPGRYALLCFITDPATGQPHFKLGMRSEFTFGAGG